MAGFVQKYSQRCPDCGGNDFVDDHQQGDLICRVRPASFAAADFLRQLTASDDIDAPSQTQRALVSAQGQFPARGFGGFADKKPLVSISQSLLLWLRSER